jgi:chitodextrinase
MGMSHSQSVSSLKASQIYHYRVTSRDANNNVATSSDLTFTTASATPDTTPPTVSITSPANGATVSGALTVSANAADNVAVASLQFRVDGNNAGSPVTAAPYTFSLNTATLTNAGHTLTAVAKDTSNNTATSAGVTITVNNGTPDTTPPTVPTGLTATAVASSQINLSWTASTDNVGVTGYNVYRGGTKIGTSTVTPYQNVGLTPSTSYSYTVAAYDAAGNTSAQSASASATTQAASSGGGIPSSLGWYDVPNAQLQSVCLQPVPGGVGNCDNIIRAWSSGVTDTKRNRMIFFGGGHNDYAGNEVYQFDLNTLRMSRLDNASPVTACSDATSDGRANSKHTYGTPVYIPTADMMYLFGGVDYCPAGSVAKDTWTLDLSSVTSSCAPNCTPSWTRRSPTNGVQPAAVLLGDVAVYDPNTQLVFLDDVEAFYSYNVTSNTYTKVDGNSQLTLHTTAVIDPSRKLWLTFGDGAIQRRAIDGKSSYAVTSMPVDSSCSNLANAASPGLAYDTIQNLIVGWPDFGNSVYLYNPTTNTCQTITYSGGPPDSAHTGQPQTSNGTWGRFAYFPAFGVFVLANDSNIDVHTLRLTAGSGSPPPVITPPTISGVTVTGLTSSSATITWTTNVAASSQVNYGTTTTYGLNSGLNATLVTSHVAMLSGLTPSTLYHYQVVSTDSSANQATSGDFTFSTTSTGGQSTNGWANRIAGQNVPGGAASIVSSYNFDSPITLAPTATCATSPCTTYQRGAQSYFTYYKDQPNSLGTDCTIAADGCSMKITILNGYFQGEPGSFDYNFSPDLSRTFGPGQEFYVQYRERIDAGVLGNIPNAEGLKHDITTEGDTATKQGPDCSNSPAEIVTIQDGVGANYPVVYANCGYSGGTNAFMQSGYQLIQLAGAPGSNYLDQVTAGCPHYSGRGIPTSDPTCWNYVPNEWFTIQKHIKIGSWNSPTSVIEFWTSHQGQPAQLITNAADAAIPNDGSGGASGRYGKIQLSAYNTAAHWNVNTAVWFDDLIVSTRRIPDPDIDTPNAPDNLSLTNIGANSVTVTWRVNSQNGTAQDDTGFLVERCVGGGAQCFPNPQSGFSQIGTTAAGANSYVDNTVVSGTTYTYRVRARNSTGMSGYAASQCFNIGPTCGGKVVVP